MRFSGISMPACQAASKPDEPRDIRTQSRDASREDRNHGSSSTPVSLRTASAEPKSSAARRPWPRLAVTVANASSVSGNVRRSRAAQRT